MARTTEGPRLSRGPSLHRQTRTLLSIRDPIAVLLRPPLEPALEVELRAEVVRRPRARAVPLFVEANHRRRHLAQLERLVELLRLAYWRAEVVHAGHEHRRRGHVADVHDGRPPQMLRWILPRELLEVVVPRRAI